MAVSIQRIAVDDIVPNRYRRMETYKISDEKIDALLRSYENSGFWDGSIQARPHPTQRGKYEIAFGHHRIEAARRAQMTAVGLVVSARSNEDMLRMMADENREEFKGDHLVAIETVGATIEAYGRGEIALPPVSPDTRKGDIRNVLPHGNTYTCATIARFLGWTRANGEGREREATRVCRLAFDAYHEREPVRAVLRKLPEQDRNRTTTSAVLTAAKHARRIAAGAGRSEDEQNTAATRAAREVVAQVSKGTVARVVEHQAEKIGRAAARVALSPVDVSLFVSRRAEGIEARVLGLRDAVNALCGEVAPYQGQIDAPAMEQLLRALAFVRDESAAVATSWLKTFVPEVRNVTPIQRRLKG